MSDFRAALRRLFQEDGVEVLDVFLDQVVGLAQGALWDRDRAYEVLVNAYGGDPDYPVENGILDALESMVRPVPAHTIDRDALVQTFAKQGFSTGGYSPHGWRCEHPDRYPGYCTCVVDMADAVLALVRPVEGVVLSREEAVLAAEALQGAAVTWEMNGEYRESSYRRSLAQRLGQSS